MAGGYREFKKIQDGVEPFFFTKVKKSLTRWELWFLLRWCRWKLSWRGWIFLTQLDALGTPDLQLPPPINIHILNAPCFLSQGNKHIRSWIPECQRHICFGIKVILHGLLKFSNSASVSAIFSPNLLRVFLWACLLSLSISFLQTFS